METKDIRLIISKNIQGLRKKEKWTQADLGAKLSISDKAISKWERGESLPDAEMLYDISILFDVPINYLFEEHEFSDLSMEDKKKLKRRELIFHLSFISIISLIIASITSTIVTGVISITIDSHYIVLYTIMYIISFLALLFIIAEYIIDIRKYQKTALSILTWSLAFALYFTFIQYNGISLIFSIATIFQLIIILTPIIMKRFHNKVYSKKTKDKNK